MNPDKEKVFDEAYEKLMAISLNQVSMEGLEELVAPDVMGWGTTIDEEVHDLKDYIALIQRQKEQSKGLDFNFERKPLFRKVSSDGKVVLIAEKISVSITTEEVEQKFRFRFSCLMEQLKDGWKLIHLHGSVPSDTENDTWHVNEWKVEKERLEKLVEKKTNDLEKKNRELIVGASLEKVRAKSMAMQTSNELVDVIVMLNAELIELGLNNISTILMSDWDVDNLDKGANIWVAVTDAGERQNYLRKMHIPISLNHPIDAHYQEARLQDISFYTETFDKSVKDDYFQYQFSHGPLGSIPAERKKFILEATGLSRAIVNMKNSGLMVHRYSDEPFTEEQLKIIQRFGNVFEQAYIRYLDLQKSEEQEYESQVDASLEKVRAMSANMNHSEDLMQIAETMFQELEILKITPLRYGIGLIEGATKKAELWVSAVNDGGHLKDLGTISLTMHPMLIKAFEAWEGQIEEIIYELKGKELSNYYRGITRINPDIPKNQVIMESDSGKSQFCTFFPFKTGALYAFTEHKPGEHGLSVLKRFANVFEQAYARFEDLKKTEEQALLIKDERDRLEDTLKELQSTQEQLIQQEKLASLGQLTAGIAHEIKNPLNFINNFSDLSGELTQELLEALKEGDLEEVKDLASDIAQNLKVILDHGTRADSIVKSMLQHSRGGSGGMEPEDINAIVKEFVNLSFHGMRAASEPINVDLEFDLDSSIGEIPLVAEDFSRVVVNLCNNAFDAMRERSDKAKKEDENYLPKLVIRSRSNGKTITLEVEDNGPGIPSEMKDKILQPFFTTKKGTEGTGLGLSITNDIIKAHGGSLEIDSIPSEKTVFTIILGKR